jgi:hypothetical protein
MFELIHSEIRGLKDHQIVVQIEVLMLLFTYKTYIRFLQWLCVIGLTKQ